MIEENLVVYHICFRNRNNYDFVNGYNYNNNNYIYSLNIFLIIFNQNC